MRKRPGQTVHSSKQRATAGFLLSATFAWAAITVQPAQAEAPAPSVPVVVDADSAPDEAAALRIARHYDHPVTVESSLTATTSVAVLPNGAQELTVSASPVRVEKDGEWADIDATLELTSDGMLAPVATETPVEFSDGGRGPLARVQTDTGAWVTLESPVGKLPEGVVDGASVTYPGVLPGVDLRLTATASGMSEVLVIKDAKAAANPALRKVEFALTGARMRPGPAKDSVAAAAADGSQLVSPTPTWWDSADGGTADGPGGTGLTQPVEATVTSTSLDVDAASAALAPGVTYPVYVDPDWSRGETAWTFVDKRYPDANYWLGSNHGTDNEAHVGYIDAANCYCPDGAHLDRSFWRFDTSALAGKRIISARFNAVQIYSAACATDNFDLDLVGDISSATTWNNQPGYVFTASTAAVSGWRSGCAQEDLVGWDAFKIADWAADNRKTTATVRLKADIETDWTTWRRFDHDVSMTVQYNSYPNAPTSPSTEGQGCAAFPGPLYQHSRSALLNFSAISSDPDAGQNVTTEFRVSYPSTGERLVDLRFGPVASGSMATVQLPASFGPGTYRWRAYAHDGTDYSIAGSAWCHFRIDRTAPGAPSVTTTATGPVVAGQPVSVSFDQASSADYVAAYAWTWHDLPLPVYDTLPACGPDVGMGGIHLACSTNHALDVTVAPPGPGAQLTVWALDGAGNASAKTVLDVDTVVVDAATLANSGHQWTTNSPNAFASAGEQPQCPPSSGTVCVPDTTVSDVASQPNGEYPMKLGAGVTWDATGLFDRAFNGIEGVITTGPSSASPTTDAGVVIDTTKSFTVAAWLTPTADTGSHQTAISARGSYNSGFLLGVSTDDGWQFGVRSTTREHGTVATDPTKKVSYDPPVPVYVMGVWDAVNNEMRLYVNGSGTPEAISRWQPNGDPPPAEGITLGSSLWKDTVIQHWTGQIGNPVVLQGVASGTQLTELMRNAFFPPAG